METEAVTLHLPKLGYGWKYTGEYRLPERGEYFLFMGEIKCARGQVGEYPIVVRETTPKEIAHHGV